MAVQSRQVLLELITFNASLEYVLREHCWRREVLKGRFTISIPVVCCNRWSSKRESMLQSHAIICVSTIYYDLRNDLGRIREWECWWFRNQECNYNLFIASLEQTFHLLWVIVARCWRVVELVLKRKKHAFSINIFDSRKEFFLRYTLASSWPWTWQSMRCFTDSVRTLFSQAWVRWPGEHVLACVQDGDNDDTGGDGTARDDGDASDDFTRPVLRARMERLRLRLLGRRQGMYVFWDVHWEGRGSGRAPFRFGSIRQVSGELLASPLYSSLLLYCTLIMYLYIVPSLTISSLSLSFLSPHVCSLSKFWE